jgi:hypothetical protein
MKKKLALVLAMILMLSLFGCGDKEDKLGTTVVGGVSEEHQEMIFEAVKELWDTDVYRKAAVDPDVMVVENALHLYMPELYGHTDVEFLLACVEGINEFGGKMVIFLPGHAETSFENQDFTAVNTTLIEYLLKENE